MMVWDSVVREAVSREKLEPMLFKLMLEMFVDKGLDSEQCAGEFYSLLSQLMVRSKSRRVDDVGPSRSSFLQHLGLSRQGG